MEILKDIHIENEASVMVITDKGVYNYQCTPGHPYISYYTAQVHIDKCIGAVITEIKCEDNMLQILTHNGAITIFAADNHEENIKWSGTEFPKITNE